MLIVDYVKLILFFLKPSVNMLQVFLRLGLGLGLGFGSGLGFGLSVNVPHAYNSFKRKYTWV